MTSRELMLSRIRAALGDTAPPAEIPREYRRGARPADLDQLVDRLEDYKAVVHRGAPVAETVAALAPMPLVVPPGIDPGWLPAGIEVEPLASLRGCPPAATSVPSWLHRVCQ